MLTEQMPLQKRPRALGGIYVSSCFCGAVKPRMWKAQEASFIQTTPIRIQSFPKPTLPWQNALLPQIPTQFHYNVTTYYVVLVIS